MDAKLQLRVQRYGWDRAQPLYESYWRAHLAPAQGLLLEMAALQAGERVLDVACGTGLVTFPAAEAVGRGGEVVGADISDAMVRAAAEEADRRGAANVRFTRAPAEALGVPEGSFFDAALCALGLMYCPDPVLALREMLRMLRPGGRAVAAVWGARDRCAWADIFPIVDARVHSEVCPLFFQLGGGASLEAAMAEAGFSAVESRRIQTELVYATREDAVGAAFAGGPVALAYSRFDEATREEVHAEYLESIAPYRSGEGGGYRIPGEFVVARGVREGG